MNSEVPPPLHLRAPGVRVLSRAMLKQPPNCLRCKSVTLVESAASTPPFAFFECPKCQRRYAQEAGKDLTFRWVHPITIALYLVQFDERPALRSAEVVNMLIQQRSSAELAHFASEFRLELGDPTQQIRDTLNCRGAEDELRRFLLHVTEGIEAFLHRLQ